MDRKKMSFPILAILVTLTMSACLCAPDVTDISTGPVPLVTTTTVVAVAPVTTTTVAVPVTTTTTVAAAVVVVPAPDAIGEVDLRNLFGRANALKLESENYGIAEVLPAESSAAGAKFALSKSAYDSAIDASPYDDVAAYPVKGKLEDTIVTYEDLIAKGLPLRVESERATALSMREKAVAAFAPASASDRFEAAEETFAAGDKLKAESSLPMALDSFTQSGVTYDLSARRALANSYREDIFANGYAKYSSNYFDIAEKKYAEETELWDSGTPADISKGVSSLAIANTYYEDVVLRGREYTAYDRKASAEAAKAKADSLNATINAADPYASGLVSYNEGQGNLKDSGFETASLWYDEATQSFGQAYDISFGKSEEATALVGKAGMVVDAANDKSANEGLSPNNYLKLANDYRANADTDFGAMYFENTSTNATKAIDYAMLSNEVVDKEIATRRAAADVSIAAAASRMAWADANGIKADYPNVYRDAAASMSAAKLAYGAESYIPAKTNADQVGMILSPEFEKKVEADRMKLELAKLKADKAALEAKLAAESKAKIDAQVKADKDLLDLSGSIEALKAENLRLAAERNAALTAKLDAEALAAKEAAFCESEHEAHKAENAELAEARYKAGVELDAAKLTIAELQGRKIPADLSVELAAAKDDTSAAAKLAAEKSQALLDVQASLSSAESENARLATELKLANARIAGLEARIIPADLSAELAASKARVAELEARVIPADLSFELAASKAKVAELEARVIPADLSAELAASKAKVAELEARVIPADLSFELAASKAKVAELEARVIPADLSVELAASKAKVAELEARVIPADLSFELAASKAKVAELDAKVAALEARVIPADLSFELAASKAKVAELDAKVAALEARVIPADLSFELAASKAKVAELEAKVAALEARVIPADLSFELAASKAKVAELEAKVAALEARVIPADLSFELAASKAKVAELEAKVAALEARVIPADLSLELDAANRRIAALESVNAELVDARNAAWKDSEAAHAHAASLEMDLDASAKLAATKSQALLDAQARIAALEAENARLAAELKAMPVAGPVVIDRTAELNAANLKIAALEAENARLAAELKAMPVPGPVVIDRTADLEAANRRIAALEAVNLELAAARDTALLEASVYAAESAERSAELAEANAKLAAYEKARLDADRAMADVSLAKARERMAWAKSIDLKKDFPKEFAAADASMKAAELAYGAEAYLPAKANADEVVSILSDDFMAKVKAQREAPAKLEAEARASLVAAQERFGWASANNAEHNYPAEYAAASAHLKTAFAASKAGDWANVTPNAKAVLEDLKNVTAYAPFPAQYTVRLIPERRDSLWRIAEYGFVYNNPLQWPVLYEANKKTFRDPSNPNLIYPGQVLDIPAIAGEVRSGMWNQVKSYDDFPKAATPAPKAPVKAKAAVPAPSADILGK